MKKIIIIFIILISYSCNSQNNKDIDITGNWYNYSMKNAKNEYYVETFIDENTFYFYDGIYGLKESIEYLIEAGNLYLLDNDNKKVATGNIKIINENTISLYNGNAIFKRIEEGIKLENFLRKNIPESDFSKEFFIRKAIWEKAHNKE